MTTTPSQVMPSIVAELKDGSLIPQGEGSNLAVGHAFTMASGARSVTFVLPDWPSDIDFLLGQIYADWPEWETGERVSFRASPPDAGLGQGNVSAVGVPVAQGATQFTLWNTASPPFGSSLPLAASIKLGYYLEIGDWLGKIVAISEDRLTVTLDTPAPTAKNPGDLVKLWVYALERDWVRQKVAWVYGSYSAGNNAMGVPVGSRCEIVYERATDAPNDYEIRFTTVFRY